MTVAGAAIVGGATLVGGLMSSNQAEKDRAAASRMSAEQLAFERQKYDEWKATYGDIEQNLAEYYSQLTPDFYEAQGLEAFQQEQEAAIGRIKTSLAQRGIEDSGLSLAMEQELEQEGALERARIRTMAPGMAAEEQRQFLQVGLGQNPGAGVSQALSQRAQTAEAMAQRSEATAGQAMQAGITAAGTALADYINQPKTPTTTVSTLPNNYVSTTPQQTVDYSPYAQENKMPSATTLAGVTQGLSNVQQYERERPMREARLAEANLRRKQSELELNEYIANTQNRQTMKDVEVAKMKNELFNLQTESLKNATFSAFKSYNADQDPRHLNAFSQRAKASPVGSQMWSKWARFDQMQDTPFVRAQLGQAGYAPEVQDAIIAGAADKDMPAFVVATDTQGNQQLLISTKSSKLLVTHAIWTSLS